MAQKSTKRPPVRRPPVKKGGTSRMFYIGISVVVVIGIILILVAKSAKNDEVAAAAANDPGAACQPEVESVDYGQQHTSDDVQYAEDPPLSGTHDPVWTTPGVYSEPQRDENVVHALEHGDIVIYWDPAQPELGEKLADFANTRGVLTNDVLVMPRAGLRADVVATSWARSIDCTGFAGADVNAFVEAHHDAGPEGVTD